MALQARNFITFILFVFYSLLKSDYAYGNFTEEDCREAMREYCYALTDILDCAQQAVMMHRRKYSKDEVKALRQQREEFLEQGLDTYSFRTGRPLNEIERAFINALEDEAEDGEGYNRLDTPDFIYEYFGKNIIPYLSKKDSISSHDFCRSEHFYADPEFEPVYSQIASYGQMAISAIIAVCDAQISYLKRQPIAYYIFKNEEFTHYRIERIYLRHFSHNLKLVNVPETGLQTPGEFCERYS